MKRKIKYWVMVAALCSVGAMHIAQGQTIKLTDEYARIQNAYKDKEYLSFDVKYTRVLKSDPRHVLDSTKGFFRISKNYYWGYLDSMEFMQNDSVSLMVYKPEKMINVKQSENAYPEITNFDLINNLVKESSVSLRTTTEGKNKSIIFSFPAASSSTYKELKLSYDSIEYRITELSYIMSDLPDGEENVDATPVPVLYVVKAAYTNYQTKSFQKNIFNTENYFTKVKAAYVPSLEYKGYQVFIASPNLIK